MWQHDLKMKNFFFFFNNKALCPAFHWVGITHKGTNIKVDLKPHQAFCELRNNQHVWQGCGEVGQHLCKHSKFPHRSINICKPVPSLPQAISSFSLLWSTAACLLSSGKVTSQKSGKTVTPNQIYSLANVGRQEDNNLPKGL